MHQSRHEAILITSGGIAGDRLVNWIAAALLGILSSSYSTLISQFTAARIGRDAAVDWMTVAAIPGGDDFLMSSPSAGAIFLGIAFHQWADFSWALVFFGLFGRWTSRLPAPFIAAAALPWALITSGIEWLFLVPVYPFAQPVFTLQQPYWIGFLVHLSSAAVYPVFPWLRARIAGEHLGKIKPFIKVWSAGLLSALFLAGGLALLGMFGREVRWMGDDSETDQTFMRHMVTHHQQGIKVAELGVTRAQDPRLRSLAHLMVASQTGEVAILRSWWSSWFAIAMPSCSSQEKSAMPGYLSAEQLESLRTTTPSEFDQSFIRYMTIHHAGATRMADAKLHSRGDLRLKLAAHSIRHEQQGEIALMHSARGFDAVRMAVNNMFSDNINQRGLSSSEQ